MAAPGDGPGAVCVLSWSLSKEQQGLGFVLKEPWGGFGTVLPLMSADVHVGKRGGLRPGLQALKKTSSLVGRLVSLWTEAARGGRSTPCTHQGSLPMFVLCWFPQICLKSKFFLG